MNPKLGQATKIQADEGPPDAGSGEAISKPPPEEQTDSTVWIIWYLRRLVQANSIYSKQLTKEFHISQPQLSCLLVLRQYGPLPLSKLAKYILVKPSTVTGIVDRLEGKGLVVRERSLYDRRVITIKLTRTGQALAAKAPPPVHRSISEGLEGLEAERIEEIRRNLATLVSFLEDNGI